MLTRGNLLFEFQLCYIHHEPISFLLHWIYILLTSHNGIIAEFEEIWNTSTSRIRRKWIEWQSQLNQGNFFFYEHCHTIVSVSLVKYVYHSFFCVYPKINMSLIITVINIHIFWCCIAMYVRQRLIAGGVRSRSGCQARRVVPCT